MMNYTISRGQRLDDILKQIKEKQGKIPQPTSGFAKFSKVDTNMARFLLEGVSTAWGIPLLSVNTGLVHKTYRA